jgi:hypothetical protein
VLVFSPPPLMSSCQPPLPDASLPPASATAAYAVVVGL